MVTHYSKLAPLKALTADFKQAVLRHQQGVASSASSPSSRSSRLVPHSSDTGVSQEWYEEKVLAVMNQHAVKYQKQFEELQDMIKRVKVQRARRFVVNRKTRVTHRILAGFDDVGWAAVTHCGWRFAHSQVMITDEEPTKPDETCDTCLPALRAVLALY